MTWGRFFAGFFRRLLRAGLIGGVAAVLALGIAWLAIGPAVAMLFAGVIGTMASVVGFFVGPSLPGRNGEQAGLNEYTQYGGWWP